MHVHVNAAESVDGKLSTRERRQVAISGDDDFDRMDDLRATSDAVMVGVGTVLADDPSLTVKSDERREGRTATGRTPNPARVVADSRGRTPTDAELLDNRAESYILVSEAAATSDISRLEAAGAVVIQAGEDRVNLTTGLEELETHGVDQLMVEGGGELIYSLFAAGLVDKLTVFVGSMVIGGRDAPTLADGAGFTDPDSFPELSLTDVEQMDNGVVLHYDVSGE